MVFNIDQSQIINNFSISLKHFITFYLYFLKNFILSVRNTNCKPSKTSEKAVVSSEPDEDETEYIEPIEPLLISRTKLVLYVSSGCVDSSSNIRLPLRQYSIWIDSEKNLLFRFKPSIRFKSIMPLLEYYIIRYAILLLNNFSPSSSPSPYISLMQILKKEKYNSNNLLCK